MAGKVRGWLMATRPKTLTAAVVPTLVGAALALHAQRASGAPTALHFDYVLGAFPAALLIQVCLC